MHQTLVQKRPDGLLLRLMSRATRKWAAKTKHTHINRFLAWRQIWRVAGRESGSPELLGSPWTSPEVPRTSPEVFGDFPGSSLTVELNSNPEVPRKFPKPPRKFRDFPGGQPLSLGSLTPSPDSQKLSLIQWPPPSPRAILLKSSCSVIFSPREKTPTPRTTSRIGTLLRTPARFAATSIL